MLLSSSTAGNCQDAHTAVTKSICCAVLPGTQGATYQIIPVALQARDVTPFRMSVFVLQQGDGLKLSWAPRQHARDCSRAGD